MPKLSVHGWTSRYLLRTMDRYGMTSELLAALSGTSAQSVEHMLADRAEITVQIAAIVRLFAAAPKVRRLKIAEQVVSALPSQNVEWRQVPSFPQYEVSEHGDVRRHGRILRPMIAKSGHYSVTLYNGTMHGKARGKKIQVHSIVARAFLGEPPLADAVVRHLNGHSHDNRPSNLRWGTMQENVQDRVDHFRNGKPKSPVDAPWTTPVRKRKKTKTPIKSVG